MLETGGFDWVLAVAFHPDGKHLLGGSGNGIRRWRFADGQEVGKQTITSGCNVICISRDGKWVVCGTDDGASVWNAELHEKFIDVGGGNTVYAVDVSPDSTRFATGTGGDASIWDIATGERLIGPLERDNYVNGVRFSPNGEHIATSCSRGSVRIFDSHDGNRLIDIDTIARSTWPITPLAWSNDGERIFAVSQDNNIKSFAVSTGSQLAASLILGKDSYSISLAGNNKFIAAVAKDAISFLDASTLAKVGTAIKGKWATGISLDNSRIATGRQDGKIIIQDLANLLLDSYGPFQVTNCPFIMLTRQITTIPRIRHQPTWNDKQTRNL